MTTASLVPLACGAFLVLSWILSIVLVLTKKREWLVATIVSSAITILLIIANVVIYVNDDTDHPTKEKYSILIIAPDSDNRTILVPYLFGSNMTKYEFRQKPLSFEQFSSDRGLSLKIDFNSNFYFIVYNNDSSHIPGDYVKFTLNSVFENNNEREESGVIFSFYLNSLDENETVLLFMEYELFYYQTKETYKIEQQEIHFGWNNITAQYKHIEDPNF